MTRLTLARVIKKMGRQPSTLEKLEVAQKRERLQARIDLFHRRALEFWPLDSLDADLEFRHNEDPPGVDGSDSEDDEEDGNNPLQASPLEDLIAPERQPLLLPSNMGLQVCHRLGYFKFMEQEKTLCIGQANYALQGLRLGLSRKSIIFREGVRIATSKTKKLRSWDQILMVDVNVRHHGRVYNQARSAIINLGATEEDMRRYQPLLREHFSVTTARIDPSLRGQRDSSLAWFWTMDVQKDMDQLDGMTECEYFQ